MSQVRLFICDSTDPAPSYERFRFDGIRFYRCTFPKGSSQTYRYPQAVPYADMPTCHIQVSGRMVEPTGVWPEQLAGWISRDEPFVIPAGVFTRLAAEDTVRWCCTGIANGERTDYVTPIRLDPKRPFQLAIGQNLLVGDGIVAVGNSRISGPVRLKAGSRPVNVKPTVPGYGFLWKTDDVRAQYPAST